MFRKKLILKILVALLIIILGSFMLVLGADLRENGVNTDLFGVTAFFGFVLMFVIFFVNLILMKRFKNKRVNTDLVEDRIFEKKKYAEENYFEYYKKVKRHIFFADLYFAFVLILLLTTFAGLSFIFLEDEKLPFIVIIAGVILYNSISFIIGKDLPTNARRNEIKENEYPKLWELINKVARNFYIKKKINVFITYDNNAGVVELDKVIEIFLGIQLVYLMCEEELENILIHEFAHFHLNHTSRSIIINKRIELWKNLNSDNLETFGKFARVLFYPIYYILYIDFDVFQTVSSRQKEDEADKYIIEKGNAQAHVNALAKMSIYNFFLYDELYPILEVYETEEITDKYFFMMYDKFMEYYELYKDLWKDMVVKRIPARIETHYPFKYRMKLVGIESFFIDFEKGLPEIERLIDFASKLIMDDFRNVYEEEREFHYLNHLKLIEEYDANESEFSPLKLFDLAHSYRKFGRLKDAILIYDKLIEETGELPKLIFAKGAALLSLYDNSGIELIYEAMEMNNNFLKHGIDLISEYCLKMGLSEEMEKIRSYTRKHRDFVINVQSKIGVNVKDKFLQTAFDKGIVNDVIEVLSKDKRIEKIYMVDKIVEKQLRVTVVGISVIPEFIDDLQDVLNNVFDYLDNNRREEFFLLSLNYYPAFFNKFKSIPMSLKYQNNNIERK